MRNKIIHTAIAMAIAAFNVWHLMSTIVNYMAHTDGGFFVSLLAGAGAAACIIAAIILRRRGNGYAAVAYLIAGIICIAAAWIAGDIPNCPICDGLSNEDLGWMNRWIKSDW